jgi:hypothetical protein
MPRRVSARLDGIAEPVGALQQGTARRRPRVVITIGPGTPVLERIDMIRVDAAHGTLHELAALRASYPCPAILDIPGMDTTERTSLLTATELMIFACTERFEWVSLRGIDRADLLYHAREVLDPAVRVAATLSTSGVTEQSLREICVAADCLILSREDLVSTVGTRGLRRCVQLGVLEAAHFGKPCLLATGLPSTAPLPDVELSGLVALARDGCAGFILSGPITAAAEPQISIDRLQMVLAPAEGGPGLRPAAQLAGPASLVL